MALQPGDNLTVLEIRDTFVEGGTVGVPEGKWAQSTPPPLPFLSMALDICIGNGFPTHQLSLTPPPQHSSP